MDLTWWWYLGPAAMLLIFLFTGGRSARRFAAVEAWRRTIGPKHVVRKGNAYRSAKEELQDGAGAKKVAHVPASLRRLLEAAGAGTPLGHYELVPKLAYLSVMKADMMSGSDHQTVIAMLEESVPALTVRPLPMIEGVPVQSTGIEFKKDPDFTAMFVVEAGVEGDPAAPPMQGTDKAIRSFLSRPVRDALRDLPNAWLRVQGKTMALTLYGELESTELNALVATADVIFAEYGADGGPSLFGDDEEEELAPAKPAKTAKSPKPKAKTKPSSSKDKKSDKDAVTAS